ncbi:GLSL Glutaminase, partial [Polyodon spathula]|nr:GLSL Glutaminase [Polyodon spathula]
MSTSSDSSVNYEDKFPHPFSADDKEYEEYLQRPIDPPPIAEEWRGRGGGHQRGRDHRSHAYRPYRGRDSGRNWSNDNRYNQQWQDRGWGHSRQQYQQQGHVPPAVQAPPVQFCVARLCQLHIQHYLICQPGASVFVNNRKQRSSASHRELLCHGNQFWNSVTKAVWSSGIRKSDPKIKDCYLLMKKLQQADGTEDRNTFHRHQNLRKESIRRHTLSFFLQENKTSIPAKFSKNGLLLAVVPGVMGIACWSPELDAFGNSWKGVHFCQELVSAFQLHSFDIRTPFRQVVTYRQWKAESEGYQIMNVMLAAYRGDVCSLRRYLLSGVDVNSVDYDSRSALHVAASEGHLEVIKFLIENAGADHMAIDR